MHLPFKISGTQLYWMDVGVSIPTASHCLTIHSFSPRSENVLLKVDFSVIMQKRRVIFGEKTLAAADVHMYAG